MQQAETAYHKQLELFITSGQFLIEERFGMMALNNLLSDIAQIKAGIPFSELGMSERRAASNPYTIDAAGQVIYDRGVIQNAALTPKGSIAIFPIVGVMRAESGLCSIGARQVASQIRAAYANENISAIIIEQNSGGGEYAAMQIYTSVISERNKPVITFSQFSASAAYGMAAVSDEIIADGQLAEFGSIGAMIQISRTALDFIKSEYATFYGEKAKEKNKSLSLALDGDFSGIQKEVNEYTERFHKLVSDSRPLSGSESYRAKTLSGEMFSAEEAKRRGLIDGIGNLNYAIKRASAWASKYQTK